MHKKYQKNIEQFVSSAGAVFLGKEDLIKLVLTCLLARGHLLIEDKPGMGKTLLVKLVAKLLGLEFKRTQFTVDLLPADVLGTTIFDRSNSQFRFSQGPIFTEVFLADELNRASPRTQSATLEPLEEATVTIEGIAHPLGEPFFFVATQNPVESIGTFPIPESQLDRFLMRLSIGYPDRNFEKQLLSQKSRHLQLTSVQPVLSKKDLVTMQNCVEKVEVSNLLVNYLQDLIEMTRIKDEGLSVRGGIGWMRAAKAKAFVEGRDYCVPEDFQSVAGPVVEHRLAIDPGDKAFRYEMTRELLKKVAVP